ncbi:prostacyclin synthase isoform X2 [Carcharodon carcharias]|uniref:prostacyclin synthase isoform X2 n=1 Tax=Carcharodon carcharias TaxID=13397 RepID=UPI001B7F344C|nr:prostacyclin synthase isoform X2 [Carcharodon carcharias]
MQWYTLFFAAILLVILYFKRQRVRLSNEPPLDKGIVPWLGHAFEFGKDSAKFLLKMKKKYGDIFTIQIAGRFITVLLDPHSFDSVVTESSAKLNFTKYALLLMDRIFNLQFPNHDHSKEKALMKTQLQGKNLSSLTQAFLSNLKTILLIDENGTKNAWKKEGLFNFCYDAMFRAGYLALFGNEAAQINEQTSKVKDGIHSAQLYSIYKRLDQILIKSSTLSAGEKKEAALVKKNLWWLMSVENLNSRVNRSSWLESYQNYLQRQGMHPDMQARAMVLQLWATQGNVGPAAFWLLLFLLKHPETMSAVQEEIKKIGFNHAMSTISQDVLDNTPIFDSVLNETLRLTAAPFITREVLQDMILQLADGRTYHLRMGDRLCLFPYLSPQMDPEIYEEPEKFKYDRFLNQNGTKKTDFFKGGKQLKYYNMPWGAGTNVCVGQSFAITSLKVFVFIMLSCFDFQLTNPKTDIPAFNTSRYGFGLMQPENDIMFQYKLKVE